MGRRHHERGAEGLPGWNPHGERGSDSARSTCARGVDWGPIEFAVSDSADGLVVTTDVDFHLLNQVFHQRVPPEIATVTPAFVLSEFLEGEFQLQRGAKYDAEIVTDSITSQVLQIKYADLVRG